MITSYVEVFIDGIHLTQGFKIKEYVHQDYINNIECTKCDKGRIKIIAEIESENKNKNYLIYLDLKEYLLRLFTLFGVNVRIDELKTTIDTDNDYLKMEHIISPPIIPTNPKDVLSYSQEVKYTLHNREKNGEFYNLIESSQDVDMIHRFRSLFATFDKVAPKQASKDSIDYKKLKFKYPDIINLLYNNFYFTRYQEIIKELIKSNLIDQRHINKINYSQGLDQAFSAMESGMIIDESVAFNLLKCIQLIRNKINHGSFEGLTPKAVSGSYELLLPLTQQLMKEKLKMI